MKRYLLPLAALLVLTACLPVTNPPPSGGLTIVFQSGSRAVVPSDEALQEFKEKIDRYVVVLTNTKTGESKQGSSLSGGDSVSLPDLPDGTWKISGAAVSVDQVTLAEGSATVTVDKGQTASVLVKLSATQKGTGQFEFRFSVPDDLGVEMVRATLIVDNTNVSANLDRGEELAIDADKNLLNASLETSDFSEDGVLASGTYLLFLDFLGAGGEVLGRHGEAINIWDDIVSSAWLGADGKLYDRRVFTSPDLASSNALPDNLELTDGDSKPLPFSTSTFQYSLPASDKLILRGTPLVDGQLLQVLINGGAPETVSWDTDHAFGLSNVERLSIRVTAPNRQTFVDYVFGKAQSATLKEVDFRPAGLTGDQYGNLYIADLGDPSKNIGGRIIKIDALGNETVLAGDGILDGDDGQPTSASFHSPYGIARDEAGIVYVAEAMGNVDGRIRKILPDGTVSTLVASGTGLVGPSGVAVNRAGTVLYVADRFNNRIVSFDLTQEPTATVVLGSLNYPDAVALSPDEKTLYVGTNNNYNVVRVNLADNSSSEVKYMGDNTYGVAVDPEGNVYVCLIGFQRIAKIDSSLDVTYVIGSGEIGGNDGIGEAATLYDPWQIYRSPYTGVFYFTERGSKKIRSFQ